MSPASAGSSAAFFPGRVSLTDLLENGLPQHLARRGGTLDDVDHRQLVIDFLDGSIEPRRHRPPNPLG